MQSRSCYQVLAAALVLAGTGVAQTPPVTQPRPAQQRYRSKITVYDLATKTTKVVYQADQVIEAPNWSRDGKFLLVNTGGGLYPPAAERAGEPKLEKLDLGEGGYRCQQRSRFLARRQDAGVLGVQHRTRGNRRCGSPRQTAAARS